MKGDLKPYISERLVVECEMVRFLFLVPPCEEEEEEEEEEAL